MPRQDVPYGGAICRLKERIAEIWDKLGEKLHSVNGVTGDAAGNVEIVSGDAAITISEDQVNHQIEIALDSSQLPAAAVSSVNGQTGAVALDASDIPSNDGTVQSDIMGFQTDISGINIALAAETNARLNAESALQTNINAVSASIPEMSVTPDPYKGVERDAQGRAYGADPASGAVDQTLVTANWVSQTGAGAPNNLAHTNADENIAGIKNFTGSRLRITAPIPYIEAFGTSYTAGTPNQYEWFFQIRDVNGVEVGDLFFSTDRDGNSQLSVALRKADGTTVTRVLATSA